MLRKNSIWPFLLTLAALLVSTTAPAEAAGSKKKTEPGPAYQHYNEGVSLMEAGDFSAAKAKFEAALEEKEEFAEAHNNLAYSLRKHGKEHYEAARKHYDRAIELDSKLAQAYMYRGVLNVMEGDEAAAKADHGLLLKLDTDLAAQLLAVIASGEEPEALSGLTGPWQGR